MNPNSNGGLSLEAWEDIDRRIKALTDKGEHEAAAKVAADAHEMDRIGAELGYVITPRPDIDKNGWRIPKPGTSLRQVYDLMALGWKRKDIHERLGIPSANVAAMMSKIRHPRTR